MSKISTLRELAEVEYATLSNLASRTAQRAKTAKAQARKDIKALIEAGLVRKLSEQAVMNGSDFEIFYAPTKAGLKYLGIEAKHVVDKAPSLDNTFHENAKIDISISFIRNFPGYKTVLRYPHTNFKTIKKKGDTLIYMTDEKTGKRSTFILEVDLKEKPGRTFRETVKPYLDLKNFTKEGMEYATRVLFVYGHKKRRSKGEEIKWRPQDDNPLLIAEQKREFEKLLRLAKDCPEHFLFLPFYQFPNIHEQTWVTPKGNKVKLINL